MKLDSVLAVTTHFLPHVEGRLPLTSISKYIDKCSSLGTIHDESALPTDVVLQATDDGVVDVENEELKKWIAFRNYTIAMYNFYTLRVQPFFSGDRHPSSEELFDIFGETDYGDCLGISAAFAREIEKRSGEETHVMRFVEPSQVAVTEALANTMSDPKTHNMDEFNRHLYASFSPDCAALTWQKSKVNVGANRNGAFHTVNLVGVGDEIRSATTLDTDYLCLSLAEAERLDAIVIDGWSAGVEQDVPAYHIRELEARTGSMFQDTSTERLLITKAQGAFGAYGMTNGTISSIPQFINLLQRKSGNSLV